MKTKKAHELAKAEANLNAYMGAREIVRDEVRTRDCEEDNYVDRMEQVWNELFPKFYDQILERELAAQA